MNQKKKKAMPTSLVVVLLLALCAALLALFYVQLGNYEQAVLSQTNHAEETYLLWIIVATAMAMMFLCVSVSAIRRRNLAERYEAVCKHSDMLSRQLETVGLEAHLEEQAKRIRKTDGTGDGAGVTRSSREYHLKFYLNASHYITVRGEVGKVHPHTWEFALAISAKTENFIQFSTYENAVEVVLSKYRNKVMNEFTPFDTVMPTMENITECLAQEFDEAVAKLGGRLVSVETSETPTRSYRIEM